MAHLEDLVLVIGASGETGSRVVKALLAKNIPVKALVRTPEKAEALQMPGVEVQVTNLTDPAELQTALEGIKYVITATGARNFREPIETEAIEVTFINLLSIAIKTAGTEHIVMCTSLGTDNPEQFPQIAPVLRLKSKAEEVIIGCGVPYTIVRPGGLVNEPGGVGVLIRSKLEAPGRISREDVAEVMVQALLQPEARNKVVEIINQTGEAPANRSDLFKGIA
ncbi:SDR family oxidoreductase [Candidatus Chlorohelix sp.]|uniref:SDR family oxidoreductase n=1 Tax=Candidatus Chlorohelix sp. TaxID=3139201 RepID=UPI003031B9B7